MQTTIDGINQDLQDILDKELGTPAFLGWVDYHGQQGREYLIGQQKKILLTLETEFAIHAHAWVESNA
jgi:hypothetical protein